MKFCLFLFLLITFSTAKAQAQAKGVQKIKLANTSWKTNVSCFEHEVTDQYELYSYDRQLDVQLWGYFIHFTDSTFNTNYSAPCGNDCFTSVSGTYKYVKGNQIEIFVENINRSSFCQKKGETVNKSYGVFTINRTDMGLKLFREERD